MKSKVVTKTELFFDPFYTLVCVYTYMTAYPCVYVSAHLENRVVYFQHDSNPEFLNALVWEFCLEGFLSVNMEKIMPDKELCKCSFL